MSAELDIGQIPDRPTTPSTSSEVSQQYSEAKPRVTRDEDLADGETKPASESNSEAKSPAAAGGTEDAPRKKNKRPTVDYVRPEVAPNKVRNRPSRPTPHSIDSRLLLLSRINFLLRLSMRSWSVCVSKMTEFASR